MLKKEIYRRFREESNEVNRWLSRCPGYEPQLHYVYKFFEWLRKYPGDDGKPNRFKGMDVGEVVNRQASLSGRERYEILDLIQDWVDGYYGSKKTKGDVYGLLRSLFAHNRAELPRDPYYRPRGDYHTVTMDISLEEFKRALLSLNTMYRAVFMIKFQAMMGIEEIVWFSNHARPQVEPQLAGGSRYLKDRDRVIIHYGYRKGEDVDYFTSIERDGLELLRHYLREERGEIGPGEPIFVNKRGNPLNHSNVYAVWSRALVRVGVVQPLTPGCDRCGGETRKLRTKWKGRQNATVYRCRACGYERPFRESDLDQLIRARYGKGTHEACRDLAEAQVEKAPLDAWWIADFRMGHMIDPNKYKSIFREGKDPSWVERQFAKAAPWLNVLSENPEMVPKEEYETQVLRQKTRLENVEAELESMKAVLRKLSEADEKAEKLKKLAG